MSSQGRSQKFVQGGGLIFLHPWGRKPLEMNRFHLIQGGLVPYPPGPWLRLWLSSNSFTPHFHTEPMYTCSNLQCCPNNCTWHATFNSWVRSFYKYFAPIFHFHSEHVLFVYILKQKFCGFYKKHVLDLQKKNFDRGKSSTQTFYGVTRGLTNKFEPDWLRRVDVYWIRTDRKTNYTYIDR